MGLWGGLGKTGRAKVGPEIDIVCSGERSFPTTISSFSTGALTPRRATASCWDGLGVHGMQQGWAEAMVPHQASAQAWSCCCCLVLLICGAMARLTALASYFASSRSSSIGLGKRGVPEGATEGAG